MELREQARMDTYPGGHYKKRRLMELAIEEQVAIVHACLVEFQTVDDIARHHRITKTLVHRLVKAVRANPHHFQQLRSKAKVKSDVKDSIVQQAKHLLKKGAPIWKASQLVEHSGDAGAAGISKSAVCKIFRQDLQLRYRKVTNVPMQAN